MKVLLYLNSYFSVPFRQRRNILAGRQDPIILPVYITADAIALDGMLTEASWSVDKPHMMFNKDAAPSGYSNTPTAGLQEAGTYNLKVDAISLSSGFYIY